MSALANLFARKLQKDPELKPIPDVVKTDLPQAIEAIKAETEPQTKVAAGDQGVAIKTQVPSDAPHVDATADPTPAG